MTSVVISLDYCWSGWLDKHYPRYLGMFHVRRKRGTFDIYILDCNTPLDVVRLIKKEKKQ